MSGENVGDVGGERRGRANAFSGQGGLCAVDQPIDGFDAYYFVDVEDGAMASTSVFESQSHEEESNQVAASWVKESIADLLPHPPTISAGHVVANT
jgi:hypothetical protein